MIKKITGDVWKIRLSSNIYFIDSEKKIIIDAGTRGDRQEMRFFLEKLIDLKSIDIVILTHMHYDHIGNVDLFSNADVYASKEAIEDFQKNANDTVLNEMDADRLKNIELYPLPHMIEGLQVISTPGHTRGSVCLWDNYRKILFSGDTIFDQRQLGRTDLPTSVPDAMMNTVIRLSKFEYDHLCPGHDY